MAAGAIALGNGLTLMGNVPAIAQDNQTLNILTQIQAQLANMNARLDGIDNRLDGIDNRLAGIDNHLAGIDTTILQTSASIFNNAAIAQNNRLFTNVHPLSPLRHPVTNMLALPFPATVDALKALTVPQLDALIAALGMAPVVGGLRDPKIVAIKVYIGACTPYTEHP